MAGTRYLRETGGSHTSLCLHLTGSLGGLSAALLCGRRLLEGFTVAEVSKGRERRGSIKGVVRSRRRGGPVIAHKDTVQFIIDLQSALENDLILHPLDEVGHTTLHVMHRTIELLQRQVARSE